MKEGAMSYLAHWIPTLVAVVILAIAALVLELQIRAEQRDRPRAATRPGGDTVAPPPQ